MIRLMSASSLFSLLPRSTRQLMGILEELLEVTAGPDAPQDLDTITSKLDFMRRVGVAEMAASNACS